MSDRDDRADGDSGLTPCCDSLLVSASPSGPAMRVQDDKFGVYRLHHHQSVSGARKKRAVFKHCERDMYIFYYATTGWSGWLIGPQAGVGRGGLLTRSDTRCVERTSSDVAPWQFYDTNVFRPDRTISVSCFADGYLDGEKEKSNTFNQDPLKGKVARNHKKKARTI